MKTLTLGLFSALVFFMSAVMIQSAQTSETKTYKVEIAEFEFAPSTLDVRVGDTIIFTNRDFVPHTASLSPSGWDSGGLKKNGNWSITFDKPGTYDYFCRYHPNMQAKILVK